MGETTTREEWTKIRSLVRGPSIEPLFDVMDGAYSVVCMVSGPCADMLIADHAAASRLAELQAQLKGFHAELAKVGLDGASAEVLVRHHRNNEAATQGAWKHVAERLQEELDAARATIASQGNSLAKALMRPIGEALRAALITDHREALKAENATPTERAAELREFIEANAYLAVEVTGDIGLARAMKVVTLANLRAYLDALAATSPAVEPQP